VLVYEKKVTYIEIKTGKTTDLFQIERYMYQYDVLIFVRLYSQKVEVIRRKNIETPLLESLKYQIQNVHNLTNSFQRRIENMPKVGGGVSSHDEEQTFPMRLGTKKRLIFRSSLAFMKMKFRLKNTLSNQVTMSFGCPCTNLKNV
jgi:hypothetical protein